MTSCIELVAVVVNAQCSFAALTAADRCLGLEHAVSYFWSSQAEVLGLFTWCVMLLLLEIIHVLHVILFILYVLYPVLNVANLAARNASVDKGKEKPNPNNESREDGKEYNKVAFLSII